MKLENSHWRFESPGQMPEGAVRYLWELAGRIAAQADDVQDVLELFKRRIAGVRVSRSSSESWADSDLLRQMEESASNAPLLFAGFMDACADAENQGLDVPSVETINRALGEHNVAYHINSDNVVVRTFYGTPLPDSGPPTAAESKPQSIDAAKPIVTFAPAPNPRKTVFLQLGGHLGPSGGTAPSAMSSQPTSELTPIPFVSLKPKLKVFICHANEDKPRAKELYKRLKDDGYDPWLDAENLLPGQPWKTVIPKAISGSHVVVVCLSKKSIDKTGFVQKEITIALDLNDLKPPGQIYIIPARLEECDVPDRISPWHWVNLYEDDGYDRLKQSLIEKSATLP
jgi:hypothetical protein